MSYDIYLNDPVSGEPLVLDFPHHMRGGTYQLGGCPVAHLNVTYNYSMHYCRVFQPVLREGSAAPVQGIRTIYGLTGAESLPVLDTAIGLLGDEVSSNYWEPTEGNAKRALQQLRALAVMRPDGVWSGD